MLQQFLTLLCFFKTVVSHTLCKWKRTMVWGRRFFTIFWWCPLKMIYVLKLLLYPFYAGSGLTYTLFTALYAWRVNNLFQWLSSLYSQGGEKGGQPPPPTKKSPKHAANDFEVNKIIFVAIPRDQQRDTVQSQVLNLHEFILLQTQVEFRPSQAVVNVVHDR